MVHNFAAPKNILYFMGGVWEDELQNLRQNLAESVSKLVQALFRFP